MTTAKRVANGDLNNTIYSSRNENRRVVRVVGTYKSLYCPYNIYYDNAF